LFMRASVDMGCTPKTKQAAVAACRKAADVNAFKWGMQWRSGVKDVVS
jgi:hypothetical protein